MILSLCECYVQFKKQNNHCKLLPLPSFSEEMYEKSIPSRKIKTFLLHNFLSFCASIVQKVMNFFLGKTQFYDMAVFSIYILGMQKSQFEL